MRKRIWILLAVVAIDRITKLLAETYLAGKTVQAIPGVVELVYTRNSGMAFSLLSGQRWLLVALTGIVLVGGFLYLRKKELGALAGIGVMMMAGGAVGNLIDRAVSGSVPDMVHPVFVEFAVFNVADACLVAGCALGVLALLLPARTNT